MEQAKLLSMSAVLTGLIWAAADSLVNDTVVVRVRFEIVAREPEEALVELDRQVETELYELQIVGPRKLVEKVQVLEPLTLKLRVGGFPTGKTLLPLERTMLKRAFSEQFTEFARLHIVAIHPEALPIVVDRLVSTEVDLVLRRLTLAYDDAPQPRHPVASLRLRESAFEQLRASGENLQLDLSVEAERLLRSRPTGQPTSVTVPLDTRPFGRDAALTPDRMEVTATLKSDRETVEVPTVPIKPVVSFANLSKPLLAVGRDETPLTLVTQTIRVTGPADAVGRLLRGETKAYGFIQFKEADLEQLGAFRAWTPEFQLPAGVELAEPPTPIELKLIPVKDTEPK